MLDFFDDLKIVCIFILKIILIVVIFILFFCLGLFNKYLGICLADAMEIPYDLSYNIVSFGFVNNVVIILTLVELCLFYSIVNKVKFLKSALSFLFDIL